MSNRQLTFAGVGAPRDAAKTTNEWLTPPGVIQALGGWESFAFDPWTPLVQPYPTARKRFTVIDNGTTSRWPRGRGFFNPPYGTYEIPQCMARVAQHNHGTALVFARTCTAWFFDHVWNAATAVLFVKGFMFFHHVTGERANNGPGVPNVLCAYGMRDTEILEACGIDGQFVPLQIPRSVLVNMVDHLKTWAEVVADTMGAAGGAVHLDDIYATVARTPKARGNPNFEAKVRQQLQVGRDRGRYLQRGRGLWEDSRQGVDR